LPVPHVQEAFKEAFKEAKDKVSDHPNKFPIEMAKISKNKTFRIAIDTAANFEQKSPEDEKTQKTRLWLGIRRGRI
jgi:hypothetical protein